MLTKQQELYLRKILTEAIKDALTDNSVSLIKETLSKWCL